MAWYPKPATGTSVRNKHCPYRNDLLAIGLAVDEGTGTSLTNLGKRTDAPWGSTFSLVNAPTWGTEAGIGDKLTFAAASSQSVTLAVASGSNLSFPRGTILIHFKPTAASGSHVLFGSGSTSGSGGQMRFLYTPSNGRLDVWHFAPTGSSVIRFTGVTTNSTYTLIVSFGEAHHQARLFGTGGEVAGSVLFPGNDVLDTGPFVVTDGQTLTLMSNGPGLSGMTGDLFGFAWWDWQLDDREIEQLAVDPAVWSRPIPTALTDLNNPMVGRVTTGSAYVGGFVTSPSLSGSCYLKILTAASINTMISAPDVSINVNTASQTATLGGALADLGESLYWLALVSSDDVTYTPLPGGMGFFSVFPAAGTDFDWAFLTDSHFGALGTIPSGYFTDQSGAAAFKYSYCVEDIFKNRPMFVLFGGDEWYNDTAHADYDQWVAWRNFINPITQSCCCFAMLGNHEREGGYNQQLSTSTTVGNQRDCTVLRKKFWVNPTDQTYPLGGENDTDYLNVAGSDWVPALDGTFDATYRTDQIGDGTDGNGPPLENWFIVSCGDLDLFVSDIYRATNIGTSLNLSTTPPWRFGPNQQSGMETAAAASTARNKVFAVHQFPAGAAIDKAEGDVYGRGFGGHIGRNRLDAANWSFTQFERDNPGFFSAGVGVTNELWLHDDILRAFGFNACIKGHDHKYVHGRKQTVNYITGPTALASSHFQNDGAGYDDVFGNFRVDYQDRASDGMVAGRPGYGYLLFSVTPTGIGYVYRRTFVCSSQTVISKTSVAAALRDLGPLLTGTNGAITLPETPRMILCVCAEADGYWDASTVAAIETDFAGENRYTEPHTGAGASAFDEPYASGSIVYDDTGLAAGSQSIYVEYAPRSIGLNGGTEPIPLTKASNTRPKRALLGVGR